MAMRPPLVSSRPAIIRNRVDFPQPEGPTKTAKLPAGISIETSRIAAKDPKDLATLLRRTPIAASLNLQPQHMIGQRRHRTLQRPVLHGDATARHRHDAIRLIRTVAEAQIISGHGKMQAESGG